MFHASSPKESYLHVFWKENGIGFGGFPWGYIVLAVKFTGALPLIWIGVSAPLWTNWQPSAWMHLHNSHWFHICNSEQILGHGLKSLYIQSHLYILLFSVAFCKTSSCTLWCLIYLHCSLSSRRIWESSSFNQAFFSFFKRTPLEVNILSLT